MAPPANIVFQLETNPDERTIEAAAQLFIDLCKDGRPDLALSMAVGTLRPLARVSGELYTAKDEHGELVGFAAWTPPGRSSFDTPEQSEMGIGDFLSQLDDEGKSFQTYLFKEELPKFADRSLGMQNGERSCYWCWFAMVREDYQRKGVCRALFDMVHEKAKSTGATMALITNTRENVGCQVAKYERLGLKKRGEQLFRSPWIDWVYYCVARETNGE
ncbi:hypothetical protein ONZ51_g757 [Trametes cubensis]|uniref:N-acetyltransferase domain-containing protein n=1 Tax=Trametes cubensis TaxID=1111947 RepID=A0AAD7U557_9APHY|nr:hypothetical protein ONZ51_g757 [Trametes cubensis]